MIKVENLFIAFYGIITVSVFVLMVVYGGLLDSYHTLLYREVSFMISPYALKSTITIPLFHLYNLNLLMFSLILLIRIPNLLAKLGALYLAGSALLGIQLVEFPMDPQGISESFAGMTHILTLVLNGICIAIGLSLLRFGFNKNLAWLSKISFLVSAIILCAGFATALFALLSMREYVGLIEKLPIAAFLLWTVLTAFGMLHSDKRIKHYFTPSK